MTMKEIPGKSPCYLTQTRLFHWTINKSYNYSNYLTLCQKWKLTHKTVGKNVGLLKTFYDILNPAIKVTSLGHLVLSKAIVGHDRDTQLSRVI